MYRDQETARARCPEHDLALGPAGECVLCRRARARSGGRPRWLSPALTMAGLGTLLLGGVALARTRTPSQAVADAVTIGAAEVRPVLHAVEPRAELPAAPAAAVAVAETETRPCEPQAAAPPAVVPARPQRNYLDEAYAAMPKAHLYDEPVASPRTAATHAPCPCANGGCPPRTYLSSRPLSYGATRTGGTSGSVMHVGVASGQPMSGPRPPSGGSSVAYRR
jgi:hypothetical protein